MDEDVPGRGPLVVEFFGPPGSGKTTVSEHLSGLLEPAGQIHTRRQLLSRATSIGVLRTASAFTKGGPAIRLLNDVLRHPVPNGSLRYRLGLVSRAMKYLLSMQDGHSCEEGNLYLLDQWLVRFLASALSQGLVTRRLMESIMSMYCDSYDPLFVHLDADRDVLVERIMWRGAERGRGGGDGWKSQLDYMSRLEITERVMRSKEANDVAHELLSELGASVMSLDADRSSVELSNTIEIFLSGHGRV